MSRRWAHKGGDRWRRVLVLPTLSGLSSSFPDEFPIGVSRGETPRVADHRFHLDVARTRRGERSTPAEGLRGQRQTRLQLDGELATRRRSRWGHHGDFVVIFAPEFSFPWVILSLVE